MKQRIEILNLSLNTDVVHATAVIETFRRVAYELVYQAAVGLPKHSSSVELIKFPSL